MYARRFHLWIVAAAVVWTAASGAESIRFSEVGAEAGIRFDYLREPYLPIGAGGAWLDYDGDGWLDLYLTQGDGPNRLFRNLGDGGFEEIPDAAGAADELGAAHGVAAADYDNDGDTDLFVTNNGFNRLFRNDRIETGTPRFVDVTLISGMALAGSLNSASAAWGDFDGDGLLDLYVANHLGEFRVGPMPNLAVPNALWHNLGDGQFENVARRLGVDVGAPNTRGGLFIEPGATLATAWSDFDADGDLDLFLINDFGDTVHPNQLFRNDGPDGDGGWAFVDVSADSRFDSQILGMGIAVGDVDNDGDLDYYASNGADNVLMLNQLDQGEERFVDQARDAGVAANEPELYGPMMGPVSWGVEFADFDLDGWLDLLVVNGWIEHAEDMSSPVQPTTYLFRNRGALSFTDVSVPAGLTEERLSGKTSAIADYDRDGDVDFFVGSAFLWDAESGTQRPAWPLLYRNDTVRSPEDQWLVVELRGTLGNRDGIGARLTLAAGGLEQIREVASGRSFLSSGELAQHFGWRGQASAETLEVWWPSGVRQILRDVSSRQRLLLVEPELTVTSQLDADLYGRGERVLVDLSVVNHSDAEQRGDLWVDHVAPDGTTTGIRLKRDLLLAPGERFETSLELRVGATIPPGVNTLVARIGQYATGRVVHQSFSDARIVD